MPPNMIRLLMLFTKETYQRTRQPQMANGCRLPCCERARPQDFRICIQRLDISARNVSEASLSRSTTLMSYAAARILKARRTSLKVDLWAYTHWKPMHMQYRFVSNTISKLNERQIALTRYISRCLQNTS